MLVMAWSRVGFWVSSWWSHSGRCMAPGEEAPFGVEVLGGLVAGVAVFGGEGGGVDFFEVGDEGGEVCGAILGLEVDEVLAENGGVGDILVFGEGGEEILFEELPGLGFAVVLAEEGLHPEEVVDGGGVFGEGGVHQGELVGKSRGGLEVGAKGVEFGGLKVGVIPVIGLGGCGGIGEGNGLGGERVVDEGDAAVLGGAEVVGEGEGVGNGCGFERRDGGEVPAAVAGGGDAFGEADLEVVIAPGIGDGFVMFFERGVALRGAVDGNGGDKGDVPGVVGEGAVEGGGVIATGGGVDLGGVLGLGAEDGLRADGIDAVGVVGVEIGEGFFEGGGVEEGRGLGF